MPQTTVERNFFSTIHRFGNKGPISVCQERYLDALMQASITRLIHG